MSYVSHRRFINDTLRANNILPFTSKRSGKINELNYSKDFKLSKCLDNITDEEYSKVLLRINDFFDNEDPLITEYYINLDKKKFSKQANSKLIMRTNELMNAISNTNVPKFILDKSNNYKLINGTLKFKSYQPLYEYYFKSIDRLEFSFYTETYPTDLFVLYNDEFISKFEVSALNMYDLLNSLYINDQAIIEGEFYDEAIRIKQMITLFNKGTIKIPLEK